MKTRRMIETADGTYRRVSESEYKRRASCLMLEGVDGDERDDTVTYWYMRRGEETR